MKKSIRLYTAIKSVMVFASITILAALFLFSGCTQYGYSYNAEHVDLSSSDLTSTAGLEKFSKATFMDLRHNPLSPSEIAQLSAALPDCEILWSVPVGNTYIDSNTTEIDLSEIDISDTSALCYLTNLEYIDARGYDYEIVSQIINECPQVEIDWDIDICGIRYSPSTQILAVGNATENDIEKLLLFDSLTKVDATGCTAYDALMRVSEQLPDCDFIWTVDIGGFTVTNKDTELNFNRTLVSDIDALSKDFENLKYLPSLKYIDMCGCGVSNEQMAAWRDTYPECKFVWEVTFGNKVKSWTVRTDIQVFSSLLYSAYKLGSQNAYMDLLLYCTDLVAIDLGHNYITDTLAFANLKKLQVLILTDNPVRDISTLAELPELRYIELRSTSVSDVTPLRECTKLVHLDISNAPVLDITPLYDCTSLEYVFVCYNRCSIKQLEDMKTALPGVEVYYENDDISKANTEMRNAIKYAFTHYESVEEFISWDNITYK